MCKSQSETNLKPLYKGNHHLLLDTYTGESCYQLGSYLTFISAWCSSRKRALLLSCLWIAMCRSVCPSDMVSLMDAPDPSSWAAIVCMPEQFKLISISPSVLWKRHTETNRTELMCTDNTVIWYENYWGIHRGRIPLNCKYSSGQML